MRLSVTFAHHPGRHEQLSYVPLRVFGGVKKQP
jgi:hypothetical protein